MLQPKNRLSSNKDINNVLKFGKVVFTPYFNIKVLTTSHKYPRFAIAVSLKISKKAVIRNKIKRRIRSILRNNLANINKKYDMVIIAKPPITTINYDLLAQKIAVFL